MERGGGGREGEKASYSEGRRGTLTRLFVGGMKRGVQLEGCCPRSLCRIVQYAVDGIVPIVQLGSPLRRRRIFGGAVGRFWRLWPAQVLERA